MWQKSFFLALIGFFLLSCEVEGPMMVTALTYPEAQPDTTAIDSTLGAPIPVPFDWMQDADSSLQNHWLRQQVALSQAQLIPDEFSPNWSANRFDGFPQQVGPDFYALGYENGQQKLLKGSDLSTISTYRGIFSSSTLPAGFYIRNFYVNGSDQSVLFLLGSESTPYFQPAIWNPATDSLFIWEDIHAAEDWLVDTTQHTFLLLGDQGLYLYSIDLPSRAYTTINNPFSPADRLSLCGILPEGEYLIKREGKVADVQYWALRQNVWAKEFELSEDPYHWLGYRMGKHFFWSDFKNDAGGIFALQRSINGNQITTIVEPENFPIVDALIQDSTLWTLQELPGETWVNQWTLDGSFVKKYRIPSAVLALDLQYYSSDGTLLVRQMSVEDGTRWIAINDQYRQAIEPVYRSLAPENHLPITQKWQTIKSYDGTDIPILILDRTGSGSSDQAASLFIPLPNEAKELGQNLPDLAFCNRVLSDNGLVVFLFPRGNRRLGKSWYQAGTGAKLQLAYDDLQATLSFCNQQQLGQAQKRLIWGIKEQALTTAALAVQRPDLAKAVFLQEGRYDLRPSQEQYLKDHSEWWLYQEGIPERLIRQYTPYLYPMDNDNSPKILVQSDKPYIFEASAKFLARLQNEAPVQQKLWSLMNNCAIKRDDNKRKEWEAMINAFFLNE